jgi:hypothetical protein
MVGNAQKDGATEHGWQQPALEASEEFLHFKFRPIWGILLEVPNRLTFVSDKVYSAKLITSRVGSQLQKFSKGMNEYLAYPCVDLRRT